MAILCQKTPLLRIIIIIFKYIYIIEIFDFLFTSFELTTSLLLLFNYLTFFNYNFSCQPFVGAFSGRIGLPPAVTGWAASCDGGP